MFIDEKKLAISAGRGGDGVALFRREIYVPRGGPDGGDGGKGGSVVVVAKSNLHALTHLSSVDKIRAEDGKKGGHRTSTGKSGSSTIIEVPLGTIIEDISTPETSILCELTAEGQEFLLAEGGNGGWGNWHFKTSVQQAPERWNPGQEGEKRIIKLTLKLIADAGLVGFPNAGKSTLLSVVSAAKPKIANYPFTTLEPQLGVAVLPGKEKQTLVLADLPGLIEGASTGKGLGSRFLKHIERTRIIVHCIDSSQDVAAIIQQYADIRKELAAWSSVLEAKPEVVVLTKADMRPLAESEALRKEVEKELGKPVRLISAASHYGLEELLTSLA